MRAIKEGWFTMIWRKLIHIENDGVSFCVSYAQNMAVYRLG